MAFKRSGVRFPSAPPVLNKTAVCYPDRRFCLSDTLQKTLSKPWIFCKKTKKNSAGLRRSFFHIDYLSNYFAVLIIFIFAFHAEQYQQGDGTNQRNQYHKIPPAGFAEIMQAADTNANLGNN